MQPQLMPPTNRLLMALLAAILLPIAKAAESVGFSQQNISTVTLGYGPVGLPINPVYVSPGARLELKTGYDASASGVIRWFRNDDQLSGHSHSFVIGRVSEADSGLYRVEIDDSDGRRYTHAVPIRVVPPVRQQLLALSTRATLSPSSPIMIGGFVIAPAPGKLLESKTVLIRAVGPSLSALGVGNPQPAPLAQTL